MSRIGNRPVAIPSGVTVDKIDGGVRVKGPKGTLTEQLPESIAVEIEGGHVVFRRSEDSGPAPASGPPSGPTMPFGMGIAYF